MCAAIELNGPRVRLRTLEVSDLPAVQRWRSDPEVTRYWVTRAVPSMAELEEWLVGNQHAGSLTLAIEAEDAMLIGYCDVFGISIEHRHAEIALMIGERSKWGQGYGREVLRILLGYLLSPLDDSGVGLHKVSLAVFQENNGARALYKSIGFREDGVLREDMYYNGRWHDQVLMSILADEFAPKDA